MWIKDEFERVVLELDFAPGNEMHKITNYITSDSVWKNIENRHQRRARVHDIRINSDGSGRVKLKMSTEWLSHVIDILHAYKINGSNWKIVNSSL